MSRRKKKSAIGLAMLDLISNSLAAVIILFIIISSLRLPSIPPERVKGTLYIKYSLSGNRNLQNAESKIWLKPPDATKRFWDEDIFNINSDVRIFGQFMDCKGREGSMGKINAGRKGYLTPCAMVYSPVDDHNTHYLVIRDPIKSPVNKDWKTGIFYQDHSEYEDETQFVEANIEAYFIGKEDKADFKDKAKIIGPTGTFRLEFSTRGLELKE